ncbi:NAD-dependent epimerase/dehydratase family protein [Candidatus Enterovibrio escicola]|uniref:dTDP-glucose 4,6-dehydratase n=1 Tax=Candidatus Enterovibrio escicola TaxID=1927127 RepID=A0A2A5T785_9GAMM|nr:NAD(P)-dependent oxidoreductase [Candidatus Enterovibrio escacola]PCS23996.1 dTDP-glucose 4,6-dehydratase [Candidatus Enterovibrio escacola]
MIKPLPQDDLQFIYSKISSTIEDLANKHIFITGATGFIGSWLTEFLVFAVEKYQLNLSISILTRNKGKFSSSYPYLSTATCLHVIEGDIRELDIDLLDKSTDYIIHAATDTNASLNQNNPLLIADTIVQGTQNVLNLARNHSVTNILFLSSGAIYGKQPIDLQGFEEDYPSAPDCNNSLSSYGEAKRYAELLCAIYNKQYGLPYVTARCFAFIGPRLPLDTHFAIGNFLHNVLNNQDIIISGNGKSVRSYMYAADLIIWLLVILTKAKTASVYNVGADQAYSIEELAQTIISSTNTPIKYRILGKDSNSSVYTPNINKAITRLGVNIYTDLQDAIIKTLQCHQDYS